MEFFDKLGKKASEAYKITADKTGKIAKETKMKFKMNDLKSQINEIYEEIGKNVYEKHVKKENISINDFEEECTKIDVLSDEIEGLLKECLDLKDKKQCPKCYKEIEKDAKFCPSCGEKQEEIKVQEVEILEDVETTEVEDDENIENQINIDEIDEDKSENLEKTIQIESNVKVDEEESKEDD
mgnify:FL=1